MSRPATARLKVAPQRGMRPSLEFRPIPQLQIDASYQRSIETGPSQSLVRRIAMHWDWGLCQPLTVAKRDDGTLWVIDGQHRLAAARLRKDIYDLPCVVVPSVSAADEAASFVALNQQRRPLTALDLFKAALQARDEEAVLIEHALHAAGLSLGRTTNYDSLKPGQVVNVPGLQRVYRRDGEAVLRHALAIGGTAFAGQKLRYFGTIFPGIAAAVAALPRPFDEADIDFIAVVMGGGSQQEWAADINRAKAMAPDINMRAAAENAICDAIAEARAEALEEDA
ncbi:ParB/RepB/Spo0J family partition protein [Sphingobium sp. H39-3-25]|uniref:ParB/RepB/Spo0J family partition protein n=1 Tax=Sphingobium arseniciresistens TaxID=3030834 RepID=UPI0023B92BEF|nr:ParB/RepB/Spo0J family partition protein [Sphingobium arseniciresistens]